MEPSEYQTWLSGGGAEGSLASAGAKLFQDLATYDRRAFIADVIARRDFKAAQCYSSPWTP